MFDDAFSQCFHYKAVQSNITYVIKILYKMMQNDREYRCNKSSDMFCYICGRLTMIGQSCPITPQIRELYKQYFNINIANQEKCWVPHIVCNSCRLGLNEWYKGKGHFTFGRPMVWRDPINHINNCYICLTNVAGFSAKTIKYVNYPTVDTVTHPIPHSDVIPIPLSPQQCTQHPDSCSEEEEEDHEFLHGASSSADPLYIPDTTEPHMLTQGDLNDLVRDLNLSKRMSELLGSRLQQWSLLHEGTFYNTYFRGNL